VIFDLKITLFSLVEGLIKIKFCTPSEKSTYETASFCFSLSNIYPPRHRRYEAILGMKISFAR
jgi:hypothetical protein